MNTILLAMKILVATSIYFVWVVRYENIVKEFKEFDLPEWLRDVTGILKMSFATFSKYSATALSETSTLAS